MNEKVCIKDVGIQQASDLSFVILIRFLIIYFHATSVNYYYFVCVMYMCYI